MMGCYQLHLVADTSMAPVLLANGREIVGRWETPSGKARASWGDWDRFEILRDIAVSIYTTLGECRVAIYPQEISMAPHYDLMVTLDEVQFV